MTQVKLYQYDHLNIRREQFEQTFPNTMIYYFSNLPNIVGIGFDITKNNLKTIAERAYNLGLRPFILTGPKFLRLLENAISTERKIVDIEFNINIGEDEREELEQLLIAKKTSSVMAFIRQLLQSDNTFIKSIAWYEGTEKLARLSLWDSGIVYINDGIEALTSADYILSSVVA